METHLAGGALFARLAGGAGDRPRANDGSNFLARGEAACLGGPVGGALLAVILGGGGAPLGGALGPRIAPVVERFCCFSLTINHLTSSTPKRLGW